MPSPRSPRRRLIFPEGGIPLDKCTTPLQRERIAAVNRHNGNVASAARELRVSRNAIYATLHRLGHRGVIQTEEQCPISKRIREHEIYLGNITKSIMTQSWQTRKWASDNIPEGGSIVDLMWSVFSDMAEQEGITNNE